MSKSLLQFEKDFQKLKSNIAQAEAPDSGIILLTEFWPGLKEYKDNPVFQSYFDEYISFLTGLVIENNLFDMTIDELHILNDILVELNSRGNPSLRDSVFATSMAHAKKLFYVGEIEKGLEIIFPLLADSDETANSKNTYSSSLRAEGVTISEFESFRQLVNQVRAKSSDLYKILHPILAEWEAILESIDHDGANCLFVDKDDMGKSYRGRMKTVNGTVELAGKSATDDRIAFESLNIMPDDPFVGVSYEALKAVRNIFKYSSFDEKGKRFYQACFSLGHNKQKLTGDSIGLAVALLSYVQLLKTEITRRDKYLSSDVAITGSIASDGKVLPINDSTIAAKIERAFFSPVKYLLIPQGNASTANDALSELKQRFPNRNLRLVTAENLSELIDNRNIIRTERVCPFDYIKSKTKHVARKRAFQIPTLIILATLTFLLYAQIFPKHMPWFDWRIADVIISENYIKSVNKSGHEIFTYMDFKAPLNKKKDQDLQQAREFYHWVDIDNDERDELLLESLVEGKPGTVKAIDDDGDIMWEQPVFELTDYPGDKEYEGIKIAPYYRPCGIIPYTDDSAQKFILTRSIVSLPCRQQLILYDMKGNKVSGPYLYTGALGSPNSDAGIIIDFNGDGRDEIFLAGTNNRYNGSGLIALDPKNLNGVSPPFENEYFVLSEMERGSQLFYVSIPETPLSDNSDIYNCVLRLEYDPLKKTFWIVIQEGINLSFDGQKMDNKTGLPIFYYSLDSNLIPIDIDPNDGTPTLINQLLKKLGKKQIEDFDKFYDSLLSECVVYYGDSIVHHLAAGINFYTND